jgi:hypothetical protein
MMHFEGVFKPVNQTEYNAEAKNFVGKKLPVQEGWIIEDGPYKGQQCYYAPNTRIGKIPQSDLEALKPIPYARWEQLYSSIALENEYSELNATE